MPETTTSQLGSVATVVGIGGAAALIPPIGVPLVIHAAAGAVVGGLGIAAAGLLLGPVLGGKPPVTSMPPQPPGQDALVQDQ